jgi:hypothetical protein
MEAALSVANAVLDSPHIVGGCIAMYHQCVERFLLEQVKVRIFLHPPDPNII